MNKKNKNNTTKSTTTIKLNSPELIDRLALLFGNKDQDYLNELVRFLSEISDMNFAFVGLFNPITNTVTTQAFYANNKLINDYTYNIKNTPCNSIINKEISIYHKKIQYLFPKNKDLKKFEVESYIGIPMLNAEQQPIGLIVLMDSKPIKKDKKLISLLKLIQSKTTLVIEHRQLKNQLHLSVSQYNDIFEHFKDVFFWCYYNNKNEVVTAIYSPSVKEVLGYTPTEISSISFDKLSLNTQEGSTFFNLIKRKKGLKNYQIKLKRKDGEPIYSKISCELLTTNNLINNVTFSVRGIIQNSTKEIIEEKRRDIAYLIAKKTKRRLTNIDLLSEYIYHLLKSELGFDSFFIAIDKPSTNELYFPFFVDASSTKISHHDVIKKRKNGLTEFLTNHNKTLTVNKTQLLTFAKANNISIRGKIPTYFVAIPLKFEGSSIGVLVTQTYNKNKKYYPQDIELIEFIATQLSYVFDKEQYQAGIIASEKYFKALIENSAGIIAILDKKKIFTYLGGGVKEILGYEPHHFLGKKVNHLINYRFKKNTNKIFKQALQDKNYKQSHLIALKDKNKNTKLLKVTINNQLNNQLVNGLLLNAEDVTEEQNLKRELKIKTKDLATIYNNANDGILKIDKKGIFLAVNKRWCEITGYEEKELLNKNFKNFTHKDDIQMCKIAVNNVMSQKLPAIELYKRYIHKDGSIIYCRTYLKAIFDRNDKFKYVIAFATDITKNYHTQKDLNDLNTALNDAAIITKVSIDGFIIDINNVSYKDVGYTRKELIGKHTRFLASGVHPKSFFTNLWQTVLAGKVWKGEICNKRKDDSFYWVYTIITPILNRKQAIDYFLAVRYDITHKKEIESNLISKVIDAQEQERERFAQEMHDGLGQILLASKMNLDAVSEDINGLDETTIKIYNNSLKLLNEGIKESRNISHGLMSRTLKQFGLKKSITDMIYSINQAKQIHFTFTENIGNVRYNIKLEMAIYRIIQELINNILKHAKATKGIIKILKDNEHLKIIAIDNGVGFKVDKLNKYNIGIGLSNIQTRISYLGGTMKIHDKVKKGSKIEMELPLNFIFQNNN